MDLIRPLLVGVGIIVSITIYTLMSGKGQQINEEIFHSYLAIEDMCNLEDPITHQCDKYLEKLDYCSDNRVWCSTADFYQAVGSLGFDLPSLYTQRQ